MSPATPPIHSISDIHVAGGRMTLKVDGQRHDFDLARLSERLADGTPEEQAMIEVSPTGYGLHWPLLDEDLSIDGLLAGRTSMESKASIARWRESRLPRR